MDLSKIADFLSNRGELEYADELLIEELGFSFDIAQKAKDDIDANGIVNEDGKQNNAVVIYMQAMRNIFTITRKLGLDVRARKELKLDELDDGDDF